MKRLIKAFIFDLDGVVVNTTDYHYQSWRKVCERFSFSFTRKDNERLRGADRNSSLDIILGLAKLELSDSYKEFLLGEKNKIYHELITHLHQDDMVPGVLEFIKKTREERLHTALASSSRNAIITIDRLNIRYLFDVLVDANEIPFGKPNPAIFLEAAFRLGIMPENCLVFEDALNGVQAARKAGMEVITVQNDVAPAISRKHLPDFINVLPRDILLLFS